MPATVQTLIDKLNDEMFTDKTTCQQQTPFIALGYRPATQT